VRGWGLRGWVVLGGWGLASWVGVELGRDRGNVEHAEHSPKTEQRRLVFEALIRTKCPSVFEPERTDPTHNTAVFALGTAYKV
jgi:hypothetical protein